MRGFRATHNEIAVSAQVRESAINTEQTLDTTMAFSLADIINLAPRREDDSNEANGKEEASRIYDRGATAEWNFSVEKAQPQHFAFLLGYALGEVASAAAGDGYQHTITPIEGDFDESRDNPTFTAAEKLGNTIATRRFASMAVDSVNVKLTRDEWVQISGAILGTGKVTRDTVMETVEAAKTATSLTLAANGVAGVDAAARLDNVQSIMVELTEGVWTPVVFTAVSDATPAIITITPPGEGEGDVNYKILYRPTEAAWQTFPAREIEDALMLSEATVNVGGTWTGSAFSGGRSINAMFKSLEWQFANNGAMSFLPGAGGAYASKYAREARSQKVALDRDFRDVLMQHSITDNDTFGLYILLTGALYDAPHRYQVEIIFPEVGVLNAPVSVDGKKLAEACELTVFEGDTYPSVIVKVKNLVEKYCAAS